MKYVPVTIIGIATTTKMQSKLILLLLLVQAICSHGVTDTPSTRLFQSTELSIGKCRLVVDGKCPDPGVQFFLYTRKNPTLPQMIDLSKGILNLTSSYFNPNHKTKFVIHGYNSDMNLDVLEDIRKGYLEEGEYNVVAVDWSSLCPGPCYPTSVYNSQFAGKCTAQMIQALRMHGAKEFHIVGFSLGAHVAGFTANNLRPYKVSRITGLDPAMPFFVTVDKDHKLDASDAEFVDVIHTNAFVQGKIESSGDVDFYVNGGMNQPGCWEESNPFGCDHHRAAAYFAESIRSKEGFWGWRCGGFFYYLLGLCPPRHPSVLMGDHVPEKTRGFYLVQTASKQPFALGPWLVSPLDDIKPKHREKSPRDNDINNNIDKSEEESVWTGPMVFTYITQNK